MNAIDPTDLERFLNRTREDLDEVEERILRYSSSSNKLGVLFDELSHLPSPLDFELFKKLWSSCDLTHDWKDEVSEFLVESKYMVEPTEFLSTEEQAWVNRLPERFRIYRGCDASRCAGLSWSTNREIASSFAKGHRGSRYPDPVILSGMIWKNQALMFTNDRDEYEVLVDFDTVKEKRVSSLNLLGGAVPVG